MFPETVHIVEAELLKRETEPLRYFAGVPLANHNTEWLRNAEICPLPVLEASGVWDQRSTGSLPLKAPSHHFQLSVAQVSLGCGCVTPASASVVTWPPPPSLSSSSSLVSCRDTHLWI